MKSNLKLMYLFIFLFIIFAFGLMYYIRSTSKMLNVEIQNSIVSAKELVDSSRPYISSYFKNKKYYIGNINMMLNKEMRGNVEIWFKDEEKNKECVPNIFTMEIDTKTSKLARIVRQERNSKIEPDIINTDKWIIDSANAISIAVKAAQQDKYLNYTNIWLNLGNIYNTDNPKWNITLFDKSVNKGYVVEVDAYTGNIINKEMK